jgi:hypothetical protein
MNFYWLTIGILVTWRVSHLFYAEDGPGDIFVRLRRAVGEGFWGSLLDCFYCVSLWVALPLAYWIGDSWKQRLLLWPALSAGAILLERLTNKEDRTPVIVETEPQEETSDVLRQQTSADANQFPQQSGTTH